MKHRKKILLLLLTYILAGYGSTHFAQAAVDQEPENVNWENVYTSQGFYYVDSVTYRVTYWYVLAFTADDEHIATYVKTGQTGDFLDHTHCQYDFGDEGADATVSEADTYWDMRFGWGVCGRDSSATNKYNCHMYAAQAAGCMGAYNYSTTQDEIECLFLDDFTERESQSDVETGDVLNYGSDHSTYVSAVSDDKPYSLQWKWGARASTPTCPSRERSLIPRCVLEHR